MPVARNAGVRCVLYGAPRGKGGGRTDRRQSNASMRVGVGIPRPLLLLRSPLSQERQHKQTRHQITLAGVGRGAAQLLGAGDTVPECTVRPAATTSGVPAKYLFQAALPYALTTRFHIKLSTPETVELPYIWPKQTT